MDPVRVLAEHRRQAQEAPHHRQPGQRPQRDRHRLGRLVGMDVSGTRPTLLALEGEDVAPRHVDGREERRHDPDPPHEPGVAVPVVAELECLEEDLVFREEPGQGRDAGDGERGDEEGPARGRHVVFEAAHRPHVLGVEGAVVGERVLEHVLFRLVLVRRPLVFWAVVRRDRPLVLQLVLDVVHGVDHRAGAEEEARLKERVRHYVEDGHEEGAPRPPP